ncbi:uncharacterized protein LOC125242657 [Leguminivora glycinivorella]|uniref:uncharacterized protein LOC125242657 n=1 Tax=Leguminivora glycinivorella TaxID=1035111 RepID=UPI00200F624B|nr:uncharacterized protein LOC125242657 [Leguminivora glycinivorella]
MVSPALVLFTLSTLAVHGKQVSTDGPIISSGCEGKTLCDIKPADYPQEEIDNYFINNPDFHKRLKREYYTQKYKPVLLEEGSVKGNCQTTVDMTAPFQVRNASKLPHVIVQSQYYEQKIQQVTCDKYSYDEYDKYGNECFGDLVPSIKRTQCVQKTAKLMLVVYNRETKTMEEMDATINVDCICGAYDVY